MIETERDRDRQKETERQRTGLNEFGHFPTSSRENTEGKTWGTVMSLSIINLLVAIRMNHKLEDNCGSVSSFRYF